MQFKIVGQRFQKIIFVEVRNKHCSTNTRWKNKKEKLREHRCYKNVKESSISMEADILVGFKRSEEMYGNYAGNFESQTFYPIIKL